MSEILGDANKRKQILKDQIRRLHSGDKSDLVKKQLEDLLGKIPYDEVVAVEQELIAEGLPQEEVIKLCDVHTAALKGNIDSTGGKVVPPGHPAHTFKQENLALSLKVAEIGNIYQKLSELDASSPINEISLLLKKDFNELMDIERHYSRKENLLFPFLEKHNITAPPKVMWAKHDETRALLKEARQALFNDSITNIADFQGIVPVLKHATDSIVEMIYKEDQILIPMSLDTLNDDEWYELYLLSPEIGFCLYDPQEEWKPEGFSENVEDYITDSGKIQLPTGSFTVEELITVFNILSVDLTFVDRDDTVRFFSHSSGRIFERNRAIIGRKVQLCHPPGSVHIVEKILDDFKSGEQDRAAFWINMGGRFIHIEYLAMRDNKGGYLGTLEVTQDLTEKRNLDGERRLLNYE